MCVASCFNNFFWTKKFPNVESISSWQRPRILANCPLQRIRDSMQPPSPHTTMNLLWWLYCASLLFPRPASSTLTGSLPHFPEWLRTTLQWAGGTSPHSIWKLRVGGECNNDVEPKMKKAFPVRVVSFPTCLKGTRSSMCVQISVTAGEFPCLRGPVAGKSDRVRENWTQRTSAVQVCC